MLKQILLFAVLAFVVLFAAPTVNLAATVEWTATVKSDFDKTAAAADSRLRGELNSRYGSLQSLQQQDTDWDAKIKAIHYKNEEEETVLRKQIKELDAAKIGKLQSEVDAAKAKYKPLFEQYTALNKSIEAAKQFKNKDLNAFLRLQANAMKAAVALARQDIKAKEAALKKAKDSRNQTVQKVRSTLSEADPLEVKIKAGKSAVSATTKPISTEWKNFKTYIKAKDARNASSSLSTLVSLSKQIVDHKQQVYNLEQKISGIIAKARSQLPGR